MNGVAAGVGPFGRLQFSDRNRRTDIEHAGVHPARMLRRARTIDPGSRRSLAQDGRLEAP